jgi:hypothetical protein
MHNCYDAQQGYERPKHFLVQPIIVVIVLTHVLVDVIEMTRASFSSQPTKYSAHVLVSCLQIMHLVISFSYSYHQLTSMHASKVYFHSHLCIQNAPWIVMHSLAHPYPIWQKYAFL